jgi:hypothetical protein
MGGLYCRRPFEEGMEVKVTGFEEAIQGIDDLKNAISNETLIEWAEAIQRTANDSCGEGVVFKGSVDEQGKFQLQTNSTPQTFDCLLDAIRKNIPRMHKLTQQIYERIIYGLISEEAKIESLRPQSSTVA